MPNPPRTDRLSKQPNSRDCFVCGLENRVGLGMAFYEDEAGRVVTEFTVPQRYQGFPGLVHGGILAAMLDEAAMRAAMVQDHNRFMVTAKMSIRYRNPVPVEVPLTLQGELLSDRGRTATSQAQLLLPDGKVGAEAEAMMVSYPHELDPGTRLEALGWRVYPD